MKLNPIYKEMLSELECDENGDPTPEIIILAEDFGFNDLYIEESEKTGKGYAECAECGSHYKNWRVNCIPICKDCESYLMRKYEENPYYRS